jgi:biotin operon repressor
MKNTISVDEWQKALREAQKELADKSSKPIKGLSAQEISKVLGISRTCISHKLAGLIEQGTIKYAGKEYRNNIIGELKSVPVYCLVKK